MIDYLLNVDVEPVLYNSTDSKLSASDTKMSSPCVSPLSSSNSIPQINTPPPLHLHLHLTFARTHARTQAHTEQTRAVQRATEKEQRLQAEIKSVYTFLSLIYHFRLQQTILSFPTPACS